MDPLSLAASIIAVIGAVNRVASGLQRIIALKNVPAVLLALNNEISDLRLVLGQIESFVPTGSSSEGAQSLLHNITLVKAKMLELEHIVSSRLVTKNGGLNRASWLFLQDKVDGIRQDIRYSRVNISNGLHVLTHATSIRIETRLEGLESMINTQRTQLSTDLTARRDDVIQMFERMLRGQQMESKKLELIEGQFDKVLMLANTTEDKSASKPLSMNSGTATLEESSRKTTHWSEPDRMHMISKSQFRTFRVRLQANKCNATCNCSCHRFKYSQPLSMVQDVLGSLFVGSQGMPALSGACSLPACRGNVAKHLNVDYFFPRWMLHKAVRASLQVNRASDPELCIRIVNVRKHDDEIFRAADEGDVDLTRKLLATGKASVMDIDSISGHSPLHLACINGHTGVIAVLLGSGADMFLDNIHHENPYDMAWSTILCFEDTLNATKFNVLETRAHFPSIPFLADHRGFTIPHQIVTNMISTDLKLAVQYNPNGIDAQDVHGRTPLHWAAARGNVEGARTLLRFGADPNIPDLIGQACLRASMKAADTQCMRLLIDAGANLEAIDKWQQTPLLATNWSLDPIGFGVILLEAGADVNALDNHGSSTLLIAVQHNNTPYIKVLLEHGADQSLANVEGESPLHHAVEWSRLAILSLLAASPGFSLTVPGTRSRRGTLLHTAAEFGEKETLELLCAHCVGQVVDVVAKDVNGKTAQDIAHGRKLAQGVNKVERDVDIEKQEYKVVDPDWSALFDKLVESCGRT